MSDDPTAEKYRALIRESEARTAALKEALSIYLQGRPGSPPIGSLRHAPAAQKDVTIPALDGPDLFRRLRIGPQRIKILEAVFTINQDGNGATTREIRVHTSLPSGRISSVLQNDMSRDYLVKTDDGGVKLTALGVQFLKQVGSTVARNA